MNTRVCAYSPPYSDRRRVSEVGRYCVPRLTNHARAVTSGHEGDFCVPITRGNWRTPQARASRLRGLLFSVRPAAASLLTPRRSRPSWPLGLIARPRVGDRRRARLSLVEPEVTTLLSSAAERKDAEVQALELRNAVMAQRNAARDDEYADAAETALERLGCYVR